MVQVAAAARESPQVPPVPGKTPPKKLNGAASPNPDKDVAVDPPLLVIVNK